MTKAVTPTVPISLPITDEWLASIGFKWHQFDRQPTKHWLLWIGDAMGENTICFSDIGIEVAQLHSRDGFHCWIRSDAAMRYGRFLHVRYLYSQDDLHSLIAGLVGRPFDPAHCWYGSLRTPASAARFKAEDDQRLDIRLAAPDPWEEHDETKGGPLAEHLRAYEKPNGTAE